MSCPNCKSDEKVIRRKLVCGVRYHECGDIWHVSDEQLQLAEVTIGLEVLKQYPFPSIAECGDARRQILRSARRAERSEIRIVENEARCW